MKKYVALVAGVVVVVLGGAVVAPSFVDWDKHKPKIQQAINDATGYEVSFGGPIDLAVLPFPHVVMEKLSVRVPGAKTDLLSLSKAEVNVALTPLFRGEVSVSSVTLVDPVIIMTVDQNGQPQWMTEKLSAKTKAGADGTAQGQPRNADASAKIALNAVTIKNGTLEYNDARSGKTTRLESINTNLSADTLAGPFRGKGDMVWNAQKIEAVIETGKLDSTAKTISTQAKLNIAGTHAEFAGLVGTAGGLDIQGEAKVNVGNVSETITTMTGKASTLPPLPFKLQGLVTAKGEQADIKNINMTFGELQAGGAVAVNNLTGKSGVMAITANLDSPSSIRAESFMPAKSVKTVKAAADKDTPKKTTVQGFLPAAITLSKPVDVNAKIKLDGVAYKGATFGGVTFGLEKKGNEIIVTDSISQMPGGGGMTGRAVVTFASVSQGAGGTVYSDPALSYDIKADSKAPEKLLSAFLAPDATKSMKAVLADPLAINARGALRTNRVTVESGSINIAKTALTLGQSSFTLDPSGKNDVVVSVAGEGINLDPFMGQKKAAPAPADKAATPEAAANATKTLQDTLKSINLPVDLTLRADLKTVTLQGTTYPALVVDGGLAGSALSVKTLSLQDQNGDVMQASGTVGDIKNLSGVNVKLGGRTGDAVALLSSFKVDTAKFPKDFGALDLSVDLSGDKPDALNFNARAKALGGDGQASGVLMNALAGKPGVDKLNFQVTHPNFERLMQKFNPSYKAGVGINKDLDVRGTVDLNGTAYDIVLSKATIGGMDIKGTVKAETGGTKPDIAAVLTAGTIPLDILSGKDRTAKTSPGTSKTNTGASSSGARWSRDPLNLSWMQNFNLDLKVDAKSVEYGTWVLNDTALAVQLKDGAMAVKQMDAKVYGGTMGLTANLKSGAANAPVSFDMKSSFKNVALEPLAASFSGAKVIKARGDVSLDLETSSSGVSPAALIEALRGSGKVDGRDVTLQGFDLAGMSRSLVSTTKVFDNVAGLAGAAFKGGETSFQTIDGPFTIANGIVAFDAFLMQGTAANITNKGQINLPRWTIDMTSSIDLAEPADAPNLDVRFQGPLDNPGNTFAGKALESYIGTRLNNKLQDVITDKLGDKNPELNNLLNNVLGGGKKQQPVAPVIPTTPTTTPAPVETVPAPVEQPAAAAPVPEQQPVQQQKQLSPEEELMRGVLQEIIGQ